MCVVVIGFVCFPGDVEKRGEERERGKKKKKDAPAPDLISENEKRSSNNVVPELSRGFLPCEYNMVPSYVSPEYRHRKNFNDNDIR
jgi:hypothetical protein